MARRVFFSFHHQKDSWRVSQVRESWLLKKGEEGTFVDAVGWEALERKGDAVVKAWIRRQLEGTGVTVVLIGRETAQRRYVRYEIEQSFLNGKGLLGIFIHKIKDNQKTRVRRGRNPLHDFVAEVNHPLLGIFGVKVKRRYSDIFKTYDWVTDDGGTHLAEWIEDAARRAGR